METKICFKCGIKKPISDYYSHPKARLKCLNKCKECAKIDIKRKYLTDSINEEYMEKQRERGKDKYHRLYKGVKQEKAEYFDYNMHRKAKLNGADVDGMDCHHWNYNLPNEILIMCKRAHMTAHKGMIIDKETLLFRRTDNGQPLGTIEEHVLYIKELLKRKDVDYPITYHKITSNKRITK